MSVLLQPFELLYRGVNRMRRALYRAGVLRGRRLPRPVISVGNIAAGGAGKTPAVIRIARFLTERGLRVAVLTRGYGRASDAVGIVDQLDADRFGDEPVLIKKTLPNVDVIVGAQRYENAVEYLRKNDCDVFVLDDGFQHLQLWRDLDVVIDVEDAAFHREGRAALRDADVVIPRRLRTLVPVTDKPVFAFAALANNEQFFEALPNVVGTRSFRDHHRYTASDIAMLKREAGDALLVTTEKDAVKIDDPSIVAAGAEFDIDEAVLERIASVFATAPSSAFGTFSPEGRRVSIQEHESKPEDSKQELESRPFSPSGEKVPKADEGDAARTKRRKRRKNPALQRVEYVGYRLVARAADALSEEGARRWGSQFGALMGKILRRRDRMAMRNLRAAFPGRDERELRAIADACWRHFGREALVYLQTQHRPVEEIAARCPINNLQLLEESVARGKGTILITAHWGGWEVAGLAVTSMVRNVRAVARPLDNELLERDLQRIREQTGVEVIDRRRAARPLMKGLAENAVILLLPDQAVQPREGVLVPFLGRPAWTTSAPAKMALKAGATIVFGFCIPDGLRHRIEFIDAIQTEQLSEEERDPVALTRRINDVLSAQILTRPDLYLWMHDRWKGTEGEVLNGV